MIFIYNINPESCPSLGWAWFIFKISLTNFSKVRNFGKVSQLDKDKNLVGLLFNLSP